MNLKPGWRRWLQALVQPEPSPALEEALSRHRETLPVLWLLGKTGAGKSSVIQRLTGDSRAQVGNGFEPCTRSAMHYDHPQDVPVMRFLDTRGLGEASYDPASDLAAARGGSHALLVLTRVDDPAQAALIAALESLTREDARLATLHMHSALHGVSKADLERAIQFNSEQVANALQRKPTAVRIDFTDPDDGFENPDVGLAELREAIIDLVPELARVLSRSDGHDQEETLYLSLRREITGYASAAAAVDLVPAVGLVAVPSLQGKMLHALAGRYDIAWDRRIATEFIAALGSGFLYRYVLSLGGRQLAKFIPVYGQSAGAAAAASISFASTYALGRAACLYLYRRKHHQSVDPDVLRDAFVKAFKEQKKP
ncbi:YcjF family protein [Granulosicoccus sp. 3-233]|uniref:YcjF family protein n=1 Tax=Granulosicoccus sp. 3-233 TaxID=3417969 RepID=UPI003D33ECCC